MIDEVGISIIKEVGFPIFVACALLWDKIKSNGSLKKAVENNADLLKKIERRLK